MKKQIKLLILIIVLILYVPISYAIEANFEPNVKNDLNANDREQNKLEFFTVDSTEKEIGSTLSMYINLSQINYDVSKFTLTSSGMLNNIETEDIQNSDGIEIEKENNEFFLIINKNELNIEQIILTYTISDNFKVGDKFTLIGKITEYKEENLENKKEENIQEDTEENIENDVNVGDKEKIEVDIENNNQENNDEILKENQQQNVENNIKEVQIEITIVEKQENEKETENNLQENKNNEQDKIGGAVQNSMQTTIKNNSSNSTQTVVYNGSRNNYLETLSIANYELKTEFSKENTTYFLSVPNDITAIKITATKEDFSSKVCIYGNDNLKVGTNKVLISVTAENGDVRNYRIFVNREA